MIVMKTPLFFVVYSWLLIVGVGDKNVGGRYCTEGWFGNNCNFRCHCWNSACKKNGECKEEPRCEAGWFGPACQYVDMTKQSNAPAWLKDDSNLTCNPESWSDSLFLNVTLTFTWARIILRKPHVPESVSLHFGEISCVNPLVFQMMTNVIDIHCPNYPRVDIVHLHGAAVGFLCTLHISGGRNVALRQSTTATSTFLPLEVIASSDKAVDGVRSQYFPEYPCFHSSEGDPKPTWTLMLARPHKVEGVTIYNRIGGHEKRIKGFMVTVYHSDGRAELVYRDNYEEGLRLYTIRFASTADVVNVTVHLDENNGGLSFCEFELFGDIECPPNTYGFQCEQTCKCFDNRCFVSTGGCQLGCPQGTQYMGCTTGCPEGQFGISCRQSCRNVCPEDACTPTTGNCLVACPVGYKGYTCNMTCDDGYYGINCSSKCNKICLPKTCNHITGVCSTIVQVNPVFEGFATSTITLVAILLIVCLSLWCLERSSDEFGEESSWAEDYTGDYEQTTASITADSKTTGS